MPTLKTTVTHTNSFDDDEVSLLSLFNRDNSDTNLFNSIDEEVIKLGGSEILVFKYFKGNDVDDVYMESRQKAISTEPVKVWAQYEPRAIEENMTQFGVEVQNDQVFVFNKSHVERKLGRGIIPGDVLKPVFQDMKFEVHQVQEESFESYGIYHLTVYAKLLRDIEILQDGYLERSKEVGGKI